MNSEKFGINLALNIPKILYYFGFLCESWLHDGVVSILAKTPMHAQHKGENEFLYVGQSTVELEHTTAIFFYDNGSF